MIHTSAPATLMLMGEHAVLHDKHALVAAASPRLHVYLKPRTDRTIHIHSSLGQYQTDLDQLQIKAPFKFILSLIQYCQCPSGFDLNIESEFSATVGLGSSAAVLVATALALHTFLQLPQSIFELSYHSLLAVQGRGSGADLMAAILGGIVLYRQNPFYAQQLWPHANTLTIPLTLLYAGYKTPTAEVIQIIDTQYQADPEYFEDLFKQIDESVLVGQQAIQTGDLNLLAQALKTNQSLMTQMDLTDPTLSAMIHALEQDPAILVAKISGSGLGDCVFGLGLAQSKFSWQHIPLTLSEQGMQLHD